jgi:hypothetical protein
MEDREKTITKTIARTTPAPGSQFHIIMTSPAALARTTTTKK